MSKATSLAIIILVIAIVSDSINLRVIRLRVNNLEKQARANQRPVETRSQVPASRVTPNGSILRAIRR